MTMHANNRLTWALVFATLLVTVATFWVGCGNLKQALFVPTPASHGPTNAPVVLIPRPAVVDGINGAGALAGPTGAALAALLTACLGLGASILNRAALRAHLRASGSATTSTPARAPPDAS